MKIRAERPRLGGHAGSAVLVTACLALSVVAPAYAATREPATTASGSTVTGTVTLATGQVAANAQVDVFLDGVSAAAKPSTTVGATVQNPLLASTTTDRNGRYALTVPADGVAVASAAGLNGGYVNLNVTSSSSNGEIGSRTVARRMTAGHTLESAQAASSRTGSEHAAADDISMVKGAAHVTPNCIVSQAPQPMNSSTLLHAWRGRTAMNSLRSDNDMSAEFAYGTTEDSSVEVAISGSSESGFGASGSVHLGHNAGVYATTRIVSRDHHTVLGDFTYGEYRVKQYIGCGWRYYYEVRAIHWDGNLLKSGKARYDGCPGGYHHLAYNRGNTVHIVQGTDFRYSADVTLPPVKLSGSHGYSNSADAYYFFGASGGVTYHHFELCYKASQIKYATVIYPKSWR